MAWIRIEDTMLDHPKIAPLSDAAFRWLLRGLVYASTYLTDGALPGSWLKGCPYQVTRQLLASGVWRRDEHGSVVIHDYHQYQPTKAQVEDRRRHARERQSRFRHGVTNGATNGEVTGLYVPSIPFDLQNSTAARLKNAEEKNAGRDENDREVHRRYRRLLAIAHAVIEDSHDRSQWSENVKHRCIVQGIDHSNPIVNNIPMFRRALMAAEQMQIRAGKLEP